MAALAPPQADPAQIRQKALAGAPCRQGIGREVVGQTIESGCDVGAVLLQQGHQIAQQCGSSGQTALDLDRLGQRRRQLLGHAAVAEKPGHARRLPEIIGKPLPWPHVLLPSDAPSKPRRGRQRLLGS